MRNVLKIGLVRKMVRISARNRIYSLYNPRGAGGKAWMQIGGGMAGPITALPTEPALNSRA